MESKRMPFYKGRIIEAILVIDPRQRDTREEKAKTKEQDEKLSSLEGKMNTLETNITDIKKMLSKALGKQ